MKSELFTKMENDPNLTTINNVILSMIETYKFCKNNGLPLNADEVINKLTLISKSMSEINSSQKYEELKSKLDNLDISSEVFRVKGCSGINIEAPGTNTTVQINDSTFDTLLGSMPIEDDYVRYLFKDSSEVILDLIKLKNDQKTKSLMHPQK